MTNTFDAEFFVVARRLSRIGGSLSILGSLYIIQNVLRDPKERRKVVNQVVVALSFADLIFSFFNGVLLQVLAPKGSAKGAIGNVGTCVATSFFGGLGFLSSTYFNASLAITYLLMIKYGWKEERLQKNRIYFMGLPLLFTLPFITVGVALGGGNFQGIFCGALDPEPAWCVSDPSTCIRGEKLAQMPMFRLLGSILQTVISLPIIVGCMILLYLAVLQIEKKNDRYRFDGEMSRQQSKRTAIQGIYYVWAFLLVEVLWVAIVVISVLQKPQVPSVQKLRRASYFIVPSQGLFNALVYLRPTYLEYLRKNPEKTVPNRIRRLFGLEIQLPEPSHRSRMSSTGTWNKFKNSSDGNSGSDAVFANPSGTCSNRFTEGTYRGSIQDSFQVSSPLAAVQSSGQTNSMVVPGTTDLIPEEQQEEQKHFEEVAETPDSTSNDNNWEESKTNNECSLTKKKSLSISPPSSSTSSPKVSRKKTDFSGSIVDFESENNDDLSE